MKDKPCHLYLNQHEVHHETCYVPRKEHWYIHDWWFLSQLCDLWAKDSACVAT